MATEAKAGDCGTTDGGGGGALQLQEEDRPMQVELCLKKRATQMQVHKPHRKAEARKRAGLGVMPCNRCSLLSIDFLSAGERGKAK